MLTSASATPQAALAKLLAGFSPECSSPVDFARAGAFVLVPELAVHAPGDPQQQDAAGEHQADDLKQLGNDEREGDPQHERGEDADQDDLLALLRRKPRGERADDDRIVAGEDDVDQQDLDEGGERAGADQARVHHTDLADPEHAPQAQHVLAADPALIDHVAGDPQDHGQSDIIEPVNSARSAARHNWRQSP